MLCPVAVKIAPARFSKLFIVVTAFGEHKINVVAVKNDYKTTSAGKKALHRPCGSAG